jgi:hypothetical protein
VLPSRAAALSSSKPYNSTRSRSCTAGSIQQSGCRTRCYSVSCFCAESRCSMGRWGVRWAVLLWHSWQHGSSSTGFHRWACALLRIQIVDQAVYMCVCVRGTSICKCRVNAAAALSAVWAGAQMLHFCTTACCAWFYVHGFMLTSITGSCRRISNNSRMPA